MSCKVSEKIECYGCPMRALHPNNEFVPPRQGTGLRLAVGEMPELGQKEPFEDGVGNWLRGAKGTDGKRHGGFYYKAGVKDDEVTFVNVINCAPPKPIFPTEADEKTGERLVSRAEGETIVAHCMAKHVMPVLKSRPWARIDLFGDKALEYITGRKEGVYKWRGSPMVVPTLGSKYLAIPTLTPGAISKDQDMIPVVINDLRKSLVIPPEHYTLQPTIEEVQAFTATEFVFDIEKPRYWELGDKAPIEMVGLCDRPYHAIVVPFHGGYKQELRRIFLNAKTIIGQNIIQYDIPTLFKELDIEWAG